MGKGRSLSSQRKLRKARLLQNAARMFHRASLYQPYRARYLRMRRAHRALRMIRRERLCRGDITQECKRRTNRLNRMIWRRYTRVRRVYFRWRRQRRLARPRPRPPVFRPRPRVRERVPFVPARPRRLLSPTVLLIRSTPSRASIRVDGRVRGKTPLRIVLPHSGPFRLEVARSCYQTYRQSVRVVAGQARTVSVRLSPVPKQPDALSVKRRQQAQTTAWIVLGVGGALGVATVVFHVYASHLHSEAEYSYAQSLAARRLGKEPLIVARFYTSYQNDATLGNTMRTVGWVGVGLSTVVLGVGIAQMALLPPLQSRCSP